MFNNAEAIRRNPFNARAVESYRNLRMQSGLTGSSGIVRRSKKKNSVQKRERHLQNTIARAEYNRTGR